MAGVTELPVSPAQIVKPLRDPIYGAWNPRGAGNKARIVPPDQLGPIQTCPVRDGNILGSRGQIKITSAVNPKADIVTFNIK